MEKEPISITVEAIPITVPQSVSIPASPDEPAQPDVRINTFAPVSPDIVMPPMPRPSNLVFLAYADNNFGSNLFFTGAHTKEEYLNNVTVGTKFKKDFQIYHNIWSSNDPENKEYFPPEGLTFKTNYITGANSPATPNEFEVAGTRDDEINIDSFNPTHAQNTAIKGNLVRENAPFANGYSNFPDIQLSGITKEQLKSRNRQYFLVGGSRGFEFDDTGGNVPEGITINMAGPIVFGIAKQDADKVTNYATITDKNEKENSYINKHSIIYPDENGVRHITNTYIDSNGQTQLMDIYVTDSSGKKVKKMCY